MTTSPATPTSPMPTAPTSPSQAAAAATPATPALANIEPAKITKTRVERAHRDIERAGEALAKAIENLAAMAAGKGESQNPTVQRVVGAVKTLVGGDVGGALIGVQDELDAVLTELAEL